MGVNGFLNWIWINSWSEIDINPESQSDINNILDTFSQVLYWWSLQKKNNCFKTFSKALNYIDDSVNNSSMDNDKALRLMGLCSDFSTDDMQDLIARIMAWEFNSPWRFSMKTIDVVHSLSKDDIILFKKFCGLVFDWDKFFYSFYNSWNPSASLLRDLWIWYEKLLYLQELWLVSSMKDITMTVWDNSQKTHYNNVITTLEIQWEVIELTWKDAYSVNGLWSLTTAWKELYLLNWYDRNKELIDMTISNFKNFL